MEAQQKRLSRPGISLDRLDCPIAEQVRHVAVPLDWYFLLVELTINKATGWTEREVAQRARTMIEIIGSAGEDPEEVVIAALQWTEIRQEAEMPFADQRGAIACLLQQ